VILIDVFENFRQIIVIKEYSGLLWFCSWRLYTSAHWIERHCCLWWLCLSKRHVDGY